MSNKTPFEPSNWINIPGYPFVELEKKATALRAQGKKICDFSIGDPDLPAPEWLIETIQNALLTSEAHRYPSSVGELSVRQSVAKWFKGRFGVDVDPKTQVCILIGAKEGLGQIARAVVNPDDVVAFTDPSYPVYWRAGCRLVGGVAKKMLVNAAGGFLPDLNEAVGSKMVYLNYPNNPTGANAPVSFLQELGDFADSNPQTTVVYDMAYSEVTFGEKSHSILEYTSNAVEFHSLSKMANATGFRVGFAVGDPERIHWLIKAKTEMDSGCPIPFQRGLAAVLDRYNGKEMPADIAKSLNVYNERKIKISKAIADAGYDVFPSNSTFYIWFHVGGDETEFVSLALENGVMFTPGSGFGENGRGWVRASVTAPDEYIELGNEFIKRMAK